MRIYTFSVPGQHEWILPVDSGDFETFFSLDGRPQTEWNEPAMQIVRDADNGEPVMYSDFPWLGEHAPVLRPPAVNALRKVLDTHGELLPLRCAETVWLFNATWVIDALDEVQSQIARFDNGDILAIERYVFSPAVIGSLEMFKLPVRSSPVFVTDKFVARVADARLEGVSFQFLWTNEGCPSTSTISFPSQRRSVSRGLRFWRR